MNKLINTVLILIVVSSFYITYKSFSELSKGHVHTVVKQLQGAK